MRSWPDPDVLILAEQQRGLFTCDQLLALGYTDNQIEYRKARGTWASRHPRILALAGASGSWEADLLAAVLWSRGVASHRAAARLQDLPLPSEAPAEITTFDHEIVPRCGIRVHHTNRMPRDHITARCAIPCTSVERTLLDLGAVISESRVAVALDHALLNGLTTMGSLDFCLYLTARRGRRGCRPLRNLIKERIDLTEVPNSPLETLVFEMFVKGELEMPQLQHEIFDDRGRFVARPDFVYPDAKLVIEGHSRKWHSDPAKRQRDIDRHQRLVRSGYRVVYVTWYDVCGSIEPIVRRIEMLLQGAEGDALPPSFSGDVLKEW